MRKNLVKIGIIGGSGFYDLASGYLLFWLLFLGF